MGLQVFQNILIYLKVSPPTDVTSVVSFFRQRGCVSKRNIVAMRAKTTARHQKIRETEKEHFKESGENCYKLKSSESDTYLKKQKFMFNAILTKKKR